MSTQLSPGVLSKEYNLATVIPTVSTSAGALGGIFRWGPVGIPTLVEDTDELKDKFGAPSNLNAETWFTGFNFLNYGDTLYITRGANTAGATPFQSFYAASANSTNPSNIFTASGGANTNALTSGMYVSQSTNSSVAKFGNSSVINVINSTAISVFGSNTTSNSQVTMYFANPGTAYNSVGLATNNAIVANLVNQIVLNSDDYYNSSEYAFDPNVLWVAKYPGGLGNSLRVSQCDSSSAYSSVINLGGYANATAVSQNSAAITNGVSFSTVFSTSIGSNTASFVVGANNNVAISNNVANFIINQLSLGDNIQMGNSAINYQYMKITGISGITANSTSSIVTVNFDVPYRLHTPYVNSNTVSRYWEFYNVVRAAPSQSVYQRINGNTAANDLLHVVVVDDGGSFTGTPGTVLETYTNVSRATDAQNVDGTSNYYVNIINQSSKYIWWGNDNAGALSANSDYLASSANPSPINCLLTLGSDGYSENNAPLSVVAAAYDTFNSTEDIIVDLVMQGYPLGPSGQTWQLGNYIIDNITATRLDCCCFVSPDKSLVLNNYGAEALSINQWGANLHGSSYAIVDTGYKYQYDPYNNVYRWIPLNGDIAGLCARTDQTNNSWWSPAGFTRGQIKNVVKLAYNPKKSYRDLLYVAGINPVVTFPGQGTILYGDKTFLNQPSPFDRINVRRLFVTLERAISLAAKQQLFEFNDAFTQAQFTNMVSPYLRNVKGLRGITDFFVQCDITNNDGEVVDHNQFNGSIYVKPARSINFIGLNFVAVGTDVQFSTVVQNF